MQRRKIASNIYSLSISRMDIHFVRSKIVENSWQFEIQSAYASRCINSNIKFSFHRKESQNLPSLLCEVNRTYASGHVRDRS